jgi:hypothetical protein
MAQIKQFRRYTSGVHLFGFVVRAGKAASKINSESEADCGGDL